MSAVDVKVDIPREIADAMRPANDLMARFHEQIEHAKREMLLRMIFAGLFPSRGWRIGMRHWQDADGLHFELTPVAPR